MARVLVADDEPRLRAAVHAFLKIAGHTVRECHSAHAVLEVLEKDAFDALLLEPRLTPRVEHFVQAARVYRPALVVIASSSVADSEHPGVIAAGVDACLSKVRLVVELLPTLQRCLAARGVQ
jgi:CheY-like chemotaxis protein